MWPGGAKLRSITLPEVPATLQPVKIVANGTVRCVRFERRLLDPPSGKEVCTPLDNATTVVCELD